MKSVLTKALVAIAAVVLFSVNANADLLPGYTPGSGSQLLTANGGVGELLFTDTAALGGSDVFANGGESFNSVLLPGAGLWNIGDTVEISGVAMAILAGPSSPRTQSGTFTFDIRQGSGGSGASGAGGLSSIGMRTATYTAPASNAAQVVYANFDSPVNFVVDANTTTIGINFTSTATIAYKINTDEGLQRYNFGNGNLVGGGSSLQRFSIAGNVTSVPEPGSLLLLGVAGMIGMLRRRR